MSFSKEKFKFAQQLSDFVSLLQKDISLDNGQWSIKGFVDVFKNVYTLSADTKVISKILEIHLFPEIVKFAKKLGYHVILAEHQNYYPDITFVKKDNPKIRFAIDYKTSYRKADNSEYCNGFTLGSHGEYFINRNSSKNIQFPYNSYCGHFCLGIIYDRIPLKIDETKICNIASLHSIQSVASNFLFFATEKWKIASDKSGSGNTANIGSITNIKDILNANGVFSKLGEKWFDDYWMNYRKITLNNGKKITNLEEFVKYRGGNVSKIVTKR